MAKNNFLGGFIGTTGNFILSDQENNSYTGEFNTGDVSKMIQHNSWPKFFKDQGFGVVATSGNGSIDLSETGGYVFVSAHGGGGSGSQDNDCSSPAHKPGGAGGKGKALVQLSSVGSNTLNYSVGTGGQGVQGNDVFGIPGNASNITIGNFTLAANGGGQGTNSPGSTGNSNANGPYLSFSTSNVFYSPVVTSRDPYGTFTYTSMPTSAGGGAGRCGDGAYSGAGANGFIYVRYGQGINASTTLTPGEDPPSSGTNSAYTPSY